MKNHNALRGTYLQISRLRGAVMIIYKNSMQKNSKSQIRAIEIYNLLVNSESPYEEYHF